MELTAAKANAVARVAGAVCGVNVAWDPYQRVSIHGLFVAVPGVVPFRFPEPIYVVASLVNIDPGPHQISLQPEPGVVEFDGQAAEIHYHRSSVLVILNMVNCVVLRPGPVYLTVLVDGTALEPAFAFEIESEERIESDASNT